MLVNISQKCVFAMIHQRILLNHLTPIASGNNRDVFSHPDDADLLIKTVKREVLEKRNSPDASWNKRLFRRYKHYQNFLRECQEHLVSRLDEYGLTDFVHTVVGFVDTDRGVGFVTRAERDQSGGYAKTLLKLIEEDRFDDEARRAFERFKEDFLASPVIVTDLSTRNIVYSYSGPNGPRFVLIDGFGEKNLIPFNSAFRWCHMRSKRKRLMRLVKAIQRAIDSRNQQALKSPKA